jgi:hypothetical protein
MHAAREEQPTKSLESVGKGKHQRAGQSMERIEFMHWHDRVAHHRYGECSSLTPQAQTSAAQNRHGWTSQARTKTTTRISAAKKHQKSTLSLKIGWKLLTIAL